MVALGRFFGRTASEGAAFALGMAVHPALSPAVREIVNEAWTLHPSHPLSVGDAALIAAQDRAWEDAAREQAKRSGVNEALFDKLLIATREGPGFANAMALWRRGLIDEADFDHALWKAKIQERYHEPIKALRNVLISPEDLAAMRQRGYIDADRQHLEAGKQGVTAERADLMFENSGLPPGYGELAQMLHRGIITRAEFVQAIREANTKVKYTDEMLALAQPILSAIQAATLRLKGWITAEQSYEIGALSGYSQQQMDRLYLMQGRPMSPVQMYNAWAREAPGPGGGTFDKADFLRAIKQSDIRPEYGETLWAIRWAYPSLFQLRRLAEDGVLDRATLLDILHKERYEPALAQKIVDGWLQGSGTTSKGLTASDLANEYEGLFITRASYIAGLKEIGYTQAGAEAKAEAEDSKRVRQARTATIGRIHLQYVNHKVTRDQAVAALDKENVPARARNLMLPEWDNERAINVSTLTAAQVRKAYKDGIFTLAAAVAELEARGYSPTDANILLGVPPRRLSPSQIGRAYRLGLMAYEDALAQLRALGYSDADAALVLGETLPTLTVSQIQEAYREQIMTYEQALAALQRLGYRVADATVLLEETGRRLTAAQVKKAWQEDIFTREQAVQRLLDLGYSDEDANIYLDE